MANVVTNIGKGIYTGQMLSGATAKTFYVSWGTGAGTSGATDTTLFTESTEARVGTTTTQQTTSTTNDTNRFVGTITAAGGRTITNAGIFDATSSGNMIAKGDFTGVVLNTGDSIAFTFNIQLS
jgi:hypothetical protein